MPLPPPLRRIALALASISIAGPAFAAQHVTLRNGFDLVCDHSSVQGSKTLLYLDSASDNYVEVNTAEIRSSEAVAAPLPSASPAPPPPAAAAAEVLTPGQLRQVLTGAGRAHDLNIDLLASVVHAESAGRVHARSQAGAEGLMQLMPGTAAELGVQNVFAPEQNVAGGAAYLDALLHRYHGNLAYALAAYNAGPAAVDHYHGIPPYRETRAYVARIIHDFNQRYAARQASALALASTP